jgi:hypothetical protein
MATDLNTLLTALYVKVDDWLGRRRRTGSEPRWLRVRPRAVAGAFPYLSGQSGYDKRLRVAVPPLKRVGLT